MSNCTATIFGRKLSELRTEADANAIRGHLAPESLDNCADCCAFRVRKAEIELEMAQRALQFAREREAGVPSPW